MATLQEILAYDNFVGLLNQRMGGIPKPLPPAFYTPTDKIYGNRVELPGHVGTQGVARIVPYGGPASRRTQAAMSLIPINLLHAFEEIVHSMPTLEALRQADNPNVQKHGQNEIARQLADFATRFANSRAASVHSAFCNGLIWYDGNGELLPTLTGAVTTVSFSVPATHNVTTGTSWATAGTDIAAQVIAGKQLILQDSGQTPKYAVYGANILGYLKGNTSIIAQIQGNAEVAASMFRGDILDGFMGMTWLPGYAMTFRDPTGTTRTFCPADTVIFLPEPNRDWYRFFEGSYPVPNKIGMAGVTPEEMVSALDEVFGAFSFALLKEQGGAPGLYQYFGDTWLPVLDGSAIYILDTVP